MEILILPRSEQEEDELRYGPHFLARKSMFKSHDYCVFEETFASAQKEYESKYVGRKKVMSSVMTLKSENY